jgi:glycogen operon protein
MNPLEFGRHEPMGAHARDGGVNFAVFSEHAEAIELCLFDDRGASAAAPVRAQRRHLPRLPARRGAGPGVRPARARPYRPEAGCCSTAQAAARSLGARDRRRVPHEAIHHGYVLGHAQGNRAPDTRDNAAQCAEGARGRAAARSARLRQPAAPPRRGRVLYEVHVKGFSMAHPEIPRSCAALRRASRTRPRSRTSGAGRDHAVVAAGAVPRRRGALSERGMVNYWGYNTLGLLRRSRPRRFAREPRAAGAEFRAMVRACTPKASKVVLDVVYNTRRRATNTARR